ncbi:MAG: transketolase [Bacteroidetes bacterium GWC2_33_15]|nr:MAG: transketolase [Bacteroidetes bacterium GWA2_33_15]OFX51235.1 MAG: transketolase [Bacteroidetes bacterium GWC2_33_15]OFX66345.1 MAG: transketolase [Bacteroidetes bacterium GWB2_32_14]OFX70638.1 MAG: transketolase [Bacteroidetes bacterium GWD2_33_33]HAN18775.1 transketolase [Bacteroidales bacterium]
MPAVKDINELKKISFKIRKDIITSLTEAGSGHLGGSLGLADIFTCIYFNILNHKPENPGWEDRDRLILSIGHVAPVFYTSLAHSGYFNPSELKSLRKLGSRLQGHPGKEHGLPGIELSAGSLGQGLSVAVGLALTAKMDSKNWMVFSIHGDGEMQEGSIWEAAMSASHYKLNNLIALVDRNSVQIDGQTSDVMEIEPLADKFKSFGWNVIHCDGHDHENIIESYSKAILFKNKPTVIIAKTSMGKGVRSIENDYSWHGRVPSREQAVKFIKELEDFYEIKN